MNAKNRQIVFFIVEGPSDEAALAAGLEYAYHKIDKNLRVAVVHGDITSELDSKPDNIVKKVNSIVSRQCKLFGLKQSDIHFVYQLTDIDGVFIPDSNVVEEPNAKHPKYTDTSIEFNNPRLIINRNHRKRANLRILAKKNSINKIPYRLVFMSSSLDHVLYDRRNLTDKEKEDLSREFQDRYDDEPEKLLEFLCDSDFSLKNLEFFDSWRFIEQKLNSLKRYTNIRHVILRPDTK